MKKSLLVGYWLILSCFVCPAVSFGQTEIPWKRIGSTQDWTSNYNFYYYKIAQVNAASHRYVSTIQVAVQGDANFYVNQGTYQIHLTKWESTPDRFDGMEIRCIAGNPAAATFYVFNNALWVRSNYQWGFVYVKATNFEDPSPLTEGTFGQTITPPTGFLARTFDYGLRCDFDNNRFYKQPYTDTAGVASLAAGLSIGSPTKQGMVSINGIGRLVDGYIYITKDSVSAQTDFFSSYTGSLDVQQGTFSYGVRPTSKAWQIYEKGVNSTWTNLFHIGANGNVGIGTSNPQAKLAVKGTVLAQRVKVSVAAAEWPDYVFSKNYTLPSLQEVESYINQHQHLPDMPAAAEVAKDGQDLGEMNRKLVQKVEELTLYIIDLQKRIAALEQKPDSSNQKQ